MRTVLKFCNSESKKKNKKKIGNLAFQKCEVHDLAFHKCELYVPRISEMRGHVTRIIVLRKRKKPTKKKGNKAQSETQFKKPLKPTCPIPAKLSGIRASPPSLPICHKRYEFISFFCLSVCLLLQHDFCFAELSWLLCFGNL